jgi:hypothetical protein
MADARRLLQEAERCFRLAHGIADMRLSEELEAIGRQFEREAEELERASRAGMPAAHEPHLAARPPFDFDQG